MKRIKRSFLILSIFTICLMIFSKVYAVGIEIYEDERNKSSYNVDYDKYFEKLKEVNNYWSGVGKPTTNTDEINTLFCLRVKKYSKAAVGQYMNLKALYPDDSDGKSKVEYYRTYGVLFSTTPTVLYNGTADLTQKENLKSGSSYKSSSDGISSNSIYQFNISNNPNFDGGKLYRINSEVKTTSNGINNYLSHNDAEDIEDLKDSNSGLEILQNIDNNYDTRIIGISDTIIKDLRDRKYFNENLKKEVDGQEYYGVYVSVVTTFYTSGKYEKAKTAQNAISYAEANNMSDGTRGKADASSSIFNLYDNILWIKAEKVNPGKELKVIKHLLENGVEVDSKDYGEQKISDTLDIERPSKDDTDKKIFTNEPDNDYEKFTYTGYRIGSANAELKVGTSIDVKEIDDGTTIHVYFERIVANINTHYIDSNDNDEVQKNKVVLSIDEIKNQIVQSSKIERIVKRKDKFLNSEINFGYFGGSITGGTIENIAAKYWSWSKLSDINTSLIKFKPDQDTRGITLDIYFTPRVVDVQFVDANDNILKHLVTTSTGFSEDIPVEILSEKYKEEKDVVYKIDGASYKYQGAAVSTASNHSAAKSDIKNKKYSEIYKISINKINESGINNETLKYGGDYSIVRYKFYKIAKSKVYVRHFVETTKEYGTYSRVVNGTTKYYKLANEILSNPTQVVTHNSKYYNVSIVNDKNNNSIIEVKGGENDKPLHNTSVDIIDSNNSKEGYGEYYEIESTDTLNVEKSRSVYKLAAKYECAGYTKYNNQKDEKSTAMVNSQEVNVSGKNTTTYVDFFYTNDGGVPQGDDPPCQEPPCEKPEKYPVPGTTPEPKTYIDVENKDGETINANAVDESSKCKVAYVPITEYVRPYLQTTTVSPYTLVYKLTGVTNEGKKIYTIEEYDAYQLVGGYISNKDNEDGKAKFVSTGSDGVINSNGNFDLTLNDILQAQNTEKLFSNIDPKDKDAINAAVKSLPTTTKENFKNINNKQRVNEDKFNGVRTPKGVAMYDIVGVVGDNKGKVLHKNIESVSSDENTTKINVYTPLKVEKPEIKMKDSYVDHSVGSLDGSVIEKNSEFTVVPKLDLSYTGTVYNKNINISNYLKNYWVILDFKVSNVKVYTSDGKLYKEYGTVDSNTKIEVPSGGRVDAKEASGTTASSVTGNIKVIACTKNANTILTNTVINNNTSLTATSAKSSTGLLSIIANTEINSNATSCDEKNPSKNHVIDVDGTKKNVLYEDGASNKIEMEADSLYYAQNTAKIITLDRIYDFKVTDCLDVNFKNVFRKSVDDNVNESTGIYYFSGIKRLIVSKNGESQGSNVIETRSDSVLNKISTKAILPLGPAKHVDSSYLQAPKLGYRFSFDLKTAGSYTPGNGATRTIVIKPSYYYISKDGTTFNDNVVLYYKNSSGKYVTFEGSNYDIYFKPNDGYRATQDILDSTMNTGKLSDKLQKLSIGSKNGFTLTENMMSYYQDPSYIQTWYGEFKLPNSTIVVDKNNNDINKPLTNGYIGVKFNIECITKQKDTTIIIGYDQNDRDSSGNEILNTTQWDYEGYLGIQSGRNFSGDLRIQLENGVWRIKDQNTYNKVRGTVILYDTDNRAANDFE